MPGALAPQPWLQSSAKSTDWIRPEATQQPQIRADRWPGCTIRPAPARKWPHRTHIANKCAGRTSTASWKPSCVPAAANDHEYSVGVVGPSMGCASRTPARRHQQSRDDTRTGQPPNPGLCANRYPPVDMSLPTKSSTASRTSAEN